MASSAFSSFYESYFGDPYMAWHDGLDTESLLSLQGDELAEAERLLLDGLKTGDYRPPAGLATLRSSVAAPALKELLPQAEGDTRVQTALALWEIEQYPPAVAALIGVLKSAPWWGVRLNAAMALSHVPTPQSVAALWEALTDPEDLVRSHAAESLLALHGLEDEAAPNNLSIAVMSDKPKERRQAIAALKQRIAAEGTPVA